MRLDRAIERTFRRHHAVMPDRMRIRSSHPVPIPMAVMLDVFGKRMQVERVEGNWCAFLLGTDGKRSPIDIAIPAILAEADLAQYFDDLYHEAATPLHPVVVRLS